MSAWSLGKYQHTFRLDISCTGSERSLLDWIGLLKVYRLKVAEIRYRFLIYDASFLPVVKINCTVNVQQK